MKALTVQGFVFPLWARHLLDPALEVYTNETMDIIPHSPVCPVGCGAMDVLWSFPKPHRPRQGRRED